MNPFRRNIGAIISINVELLLASIFGVLAWVLWPTTPEWWGLGVVSILFWMGAAGGLSSALGAIRSLYARERALADYMAQGRAPKAARLASHADLQKAGMLDG